MWTPDGKVRKRRQSSNVPGHAHELTFCCHRRLALLSKDRTRSWLVDAIDHARHALDLEMWAYVIMPDPVHILVLPRRDDYRVSEILKVIKQPVGQLAIRFLRAQSPAWLERLKVHRSNGRSGYRFWQQGGGYDRDMHNAATAWASVAYIHDNPVCQGLTSRPEDWPWSSAAWYAGQTDVKLAMAGRPPDPPP